MEPTNTEKVVAGFSPALVLVVAIGGLKAALTASSVESAVYILLLVCWISLLMSGIWLSRCFFAYRFAWPFVVCLVGLAAGWTWQRYVYVTYLPRKFLEYGYFLKPAGKHVRVLLIEAPVQAITALLVIVLAVAALVAWRRSARISLVLLVAWGFAAFVAFGIPAFGLSLQGDAAIFI
jgi:hypothetical protein